MLLFVKKYEQILGGSGSNYAIDGDISATNIWMPDTSANTEWLQVDLLCPETIIKVVKLNAGCCFILKKKKTFFFR